MFFLLAQARFVKESAKEKVLMKVRIIVPVSAFEPLPVIEKSIESMKNLEKESFNVDITYVIDAKEEDSRIRSLEKIAYEEGLKLLVRRSNRGRRAGALNDAINMDPNADYFAIFDVDSRPEANFLKKCVKALEEDKEAVFASSSRYIINEGIIPRIVSAEYELISFLYEFLSKENADCFLHFNGLIGVIRGELFRRERFDEEKMCEDIDMMDRVYLRRKRAICAKETRLGEQAPITLGDLYQQRVRWWSAPLEELSSYLGDFINAKIPIGIKISWLVAMFTPSAFFFLLPFVPAYFFISFLLSSSPSKNRKKKDFILKFVGLTSHSIFMQMCSLHALVKFMMKQKSWKNIKRDMV